MRDDRGAGAVLAIALVAATVIVTLAVLALGAALALRQRVIGAADASALRSEEPHV